MRMVMVYGMGFVCLGVTAYAVQTLNQEEGPPPDSAPVTPAQVSDAVGVETPSKARFRRMVTALREGGGEAESNDAAPGESTPVPFTAPKLEDARGGVRHAFARLEAMSNKGKLTQVQWHQEFRHANDAVSALAMATDANDRAQMADLEEAVQELQELILDVRVKGARGRKLDMRGRAPSP